MGIEKAFKAIDTEFNWSKIMNGNYFKSINWSSLIGMLFTPANLVAFFSAMGALGLTTAMGLQNQVTTSPTGAILSPEDRQLFTTMAQDIAVSTGQSAESIVDAMNLLYPIMGQNADATTKLSLLIAQAAAATGGNSADLAKSFGPLLQSLGIHDLSAASDVLTSIMNAASQAGLQMTDFINAFEPLAGDAKVAGLSTAQLSGVLMQFGEAIQSVGIPQASSAFKTLFDILTGANSGAIALGSLAGGTAKLRAEVESGNTATALNDISAAVNSLLQNGKLTMLGGSFDLSADGVAAFSGGITKFPLDKVKSIQEAFDTTETTSRALSEAWESLKKASSDLMTDMLPFLTALANAATLTATALDLMVKAFNDVDSAFTSLFSGDFKKFWNELNGDSLSPNGGSNAVSTPKTAPNVNSTNIFNFNISGTGQGVNVGNSIVKQLGNQANNLSPGAGSSTIPRMQMTVPLPAL